MKVYIRTQSEEDANLGIDNVEMSLFEFKDEHLTGFYVIEDTIMLVIHGGHYPAQWSQKLEDHLRLIVNKPNTK